MTSITRWTQERPIWSDIDWDKPKKCKSQLNYLRFAVFGYKFVFTTLIDWNKLKEIAGWIQKIDLKVKLIDVAVIVFITNVVTFHKIVVSVYFKIV